MHERKSCFLKDFIKQTKSVFSFKKERLNYWAGKHELLNALD